MKKIKIITGIAIAIAATIGVCNMEEKNTLSDIMLENVEALADPEQPNIDDCIYCPGNVCEALHPTDSTLDKKVINATWP